MIFFLFFSSLLCRTTNVIQKAHLHRHSKTAIVHGQSALQFLYINTLESYTYNNFKYFFIFFFYSTRRIYNYRGHPSRTDYLIIHTNLSTRRPNNLSNSIRICMLCKFTRTMFVLVPPNRAIACVRVSIDCYRTNKKKQFIPQPSGLSDDLLYSSTANKYRIFILNFIYRAITNWIVHTFYEYFMSLISENKTINGIRGKTNLEEL